MSVKISYLALTIGPIYKTIQRAKKTRELWAASFILSQFMREILLRLEDRKFGTALSPDVETLKSEETWHGAGIWNDNCFYSLNPEKVEELKITLPGLIQEAKASTIAHIKLDYDRSKKKLPLPASALVTLFDQHFYCRAVLHEREVNNTDLEPVLLELGDLLASAEMLELAPQKHDNYVSEALFRAETVLGLYKLGFADDDKVFTHLQAGRRLPSLLEIATREFKKEDSKQAYNEVVEAVSTLYREQTERKDVPTDPIQIRIAQEETSGTPDEDNAILDILKKIKTPDNKSVFKKRHKYVAIVQSDGDGISQLIRNFKDDDLKSMKAFSQQLMAFSKDAVGKIADYEGLPVYAGGDDLLFIAPLRNHKGENLFDLLRKIRQAFKDNPMLEKTSLSFGISVSYYKYPLGEALEEGRKQLFRVAKKLQYDTLHPKHDGQTGSSESHKKNALSYRVLLHGGQAFGAVLQQSGPTWEAWEKIMKNSGAADTAFLSGMVHRLERLEYLLEAACADGTAGYFFRQHFNEAKGEQQKQFVKNVQGLAEAIYREYSVLKIDADCQKEFFEGQLHLPENERKKNHDPAVLRRHFCNNLLYSALRMVQFLNAEDHD